MTSTNCRYRVKRNDTRSERGCKLQSFVEIKISGILLLNHWQALELLSIPFFLNVKWSKMFNLFYIMIVLIGLSATFQRLKHLNCMTNTQLFCKSDINIYCFRLIYKILVKYRSLQTKITETKQNRTEHAICWRPNSSIYIKPLSCVRCVYYIP